MALSTNWMRLWRQYDVTKWCTVVVHRWKMFKMDLFLRKNKFLTFFNFLIKLRNCRCFYAKWTKKYYNWVCLNDNYKQKLHIQQFSTICQFSWRNGDVIRHFQYSMAMLWSLGSKCAHTCQMWLRYHVYFVFKLWLLPQTILLKIKWISDTFLSISRFPIPFPFPMLI
jgi:hypothetical protein